MRWTKRGYLLTGCMAAVASIVLGFAYHFVQDQPICRSVSPSEARAAEAETDYDNAQHSDAGEQLPQPAYVLETTAKPGTFRLRDNYFKNIYEKAYREVMAEENERKARGDHSHHQLFCIPIKE